MKVYDIGALGIDVVADLARKALQEGKIIVYPTETTYGIGCDALNPSAVEKIGKVKRVKKNRLGYIWLVKDLAMARKYARFSPRSLKLAKKYWPGAVTLIFGNVALRVSSHPLVQSIFEDFDHPLVSTSANISGQKPFRSVKEVVRVFEAKKYRPDFVFDAGKIANTVPSTMVDCSGDGMRVIREGIVRL
jgi:tRNA threonylcarbamoyl adenosine modification protein (Sua5/YciO/YrdC/YwlC family)